MDATGWDQAINKTAIALQYDPSESKNQAPLVTAKGHHEWAEEMLAIARQYDIPIFENPGLASFLNTLETGDEIPPLLYRVIAEMIAFSYALEK